MSRFRIALAALTVAGALSACGNDRSASNTAAADTAVANTSVANTSVVDTSVVDTAAANAAAPAALQFSAPSVGGGGAIDFTQFAGKPVVLWFWAPT